MVCVDPHIRDVIVEDFSDFVNDPCCELRRHFRGSDPASHSFDLSFLCQVHSLQFACVHLPNSDYAATKRCETSLDDFDMWSWRAELIKDEGKGA